jgi:hypothetical protein
MALKIEYKVKNEVPVKTYGEKKHAEKKHARPVFSLHFQLSLHFSPEWVVVTKNFKVYNED